MLTPDQFDYPLPAALIANTPSRERDQCRLLVFRRVTGTWQHRYFYQLPAILEENQLQVALVRNTSKVIPARLLGRKSTGGHVEVLLVRQRHSRDQEQVWECLTKPALKSGTRIDFPGTDGYAICSRVYQHYSRELVFPYNLEDFRQFLRQYGQTPIPPYIHSPLAEAELRDVYQTVYARDEGSVAAPTAGLHFTAALTQDLRAAGHQFIDVTLHVGLGTFLGVKVDDLRQHQMHSEYYRITPPELQKLAAAITAGRPLLAIGTTATRVLESIYSRILCGNNQPQYSRKICGNTTTTPLPRQLRPDLDLTQTISGDTDIFLYPPAPFHLTDHLITNFHLPRSTLLMLVAAFASQPNAAPTFTTWEKSPLGQAYADAIAKHYRFFSFGDAMLIL